MRGPPKMQNETLWERDARLADLWARDYCRTTELGERALNEGWGRQVHQWARSYACECYRHGKVPDTNARPTPAEIDHWFRHCRSPSRTMAHPDARDARDWTDIDRHVVLGEAFKPEIGIRLAAKIAQLKRMPGETAE